MAKNVPISDAAPLRAVLDAVGERPPVNGERSDKKNYAERLSRALAVLVARGLRSYFPDVRPTEDDIGHETPFGGEGGKKRLDVAVWDDRDGLLLDTSIKTYSFQDWDQEHQRAGRYTKNIVRNDHELRAEADRIHRRQPYSVLVGLMFMPAQACDDGKADKSSFAHAVLTFRERTGRRGPEDLRFDRFEAFFIGVYEYEGDARGQCKFFDVTSAPPRQGRPRASDTLTFSGLIERVVTLVRLRNAPEPEWGEAEQ